MLDIADQLPGSADVVVVGGGVIGAAITYYLAKQSIDVCLIERYDLGAGTTRAAAAAALLQTKTSATKLALARESLTLLDDFHLECDGCFEFEHSGSMLVANSEDELILVQDMVEKLNSLGLDVKLIDGEEARSIMPVIGPGVVGASFSPLDAKVNPLELVIAYATIANRHGARLCTYTEIIGINREKDRITSVCTTKGDIQTETVVNATGVWSSQLAFMVGLKIPVTPLKGELFVTEPVPPAMNGTLISAKYLLSKINLESEGELSDQPKRSAGITLVQVGRGNFLIGSTREFAGYDRRSSYAGISELARQLVELTPCLAEKHIIRTYAGLRPVTPDGMPIIGRVPGLPGLLIASGHGGDGLILSAITAKMIGDVYSNNVDYESVSPYAVDRFLSQ